MPSHAQPDCRDYPPQPGCPHQHVADAGAKSEAFFVDVVEAFRGGARFLDQRPSSITVGMRATGLSPRLFVDISMDQNQEELKFPPEILAACGRHSAACTQFPMEIRRPRCRLEARGLL